MAEEKQAPQKAQGGSTAAVVLLTIAGLIVGGMFAYAGFDMVMMRSVAGNTLAEAYYNAWGIAVMGLGGFCACLLWGLAALIGKK